MLGQGAAFWQSRKQKVESRKGEGESRKQKVESRNGEEHSREQKAESRNEGEGTVLALIILLTIAAVWQTEAGRVFQYRGQGRWSGPWDNPNTFGMLMGVGVVLSLGRLVLRKAESRKQKAEILGEYPTSNIEPPTSPVEKAENRKQKAEMGDGGDREDEHPTSNAEHGILNWRLWVGRGFLLGAGGVMGWGLLKSYSRGAWLGTAVALTHLGYEKLKAEMLKTENRRQKGEGSAGKAESGKQKAEISPGLLQWAGRQRVSLAIICASVGLLAFWSFRDTERLVARRAFSVGNVNDFSWRNRVSAYEGSLQMMADKPWLGFGWNQPERAYEQFYRKPQVAEGAAIQLNDYFTLGTALGAPALLCFVVYVGLALIRPLTTDYGPRTTDYGLRTTDSYLKAICRAAAVVLVVAFWFDGGLFKLATAGPFWILLELGKGDLATDYAPLADI